MSIKKLRKRYHEKIFDELLRFRKNKIKGDYPNNADGNSRISVEIAKEIINQIGFEPKYGEISGQRVGNTFERITKEFIEDAYTLLSHIRPGNWIYSLRTKISDYDQYKDLADIERVISGNRQLATTLGKDYIITPDIVIARESVSDNEINKDKKIVNDKDSFADLTPLRKSNFKFPRPILHASISCKWTIRSDRVQNARTEALNLIRNRKGNLPHIVAITAEPTATRIASLALGTGDLDCVYHFALIELKAAIVKSKDESQMDMLNMLVEGRRLRDISDLPFDLAV